MQRGFGHVKRMGNERMIKRACDLGVEGIQHIEKTIVEIMQIDVMITFCMHYV